MDNNTLIALGSASAIQTDWINKTVNGTVPLEGTIIMYANNGKVFIDYVENSGTVFHQPLKYGKVS